MPASSIRVLVAEDFPSFRRYLVSRMQSRADFQIICEVADGSEAIQKARALQPDLILLDIGLPGRNGIEAAREIRSLSPNSKILFVSEITPRTLWKQPYTQERSALSQSR